MECWYEEWESELGSDILETIRKEAISDVFEELENFLQKHSKSKVYEVLNAYPGHGKTTALKIFIKRMIKGKRDIGGLVVLREKEQLREFEEFIGNGKHDIIYIDSDNYMEVKDTISEFQFVLITHQRLKNLVLNEQHKEILLNWQQQRRIIFIDEAPPLIHSATFKVDGHLDWLDDCLKAITGFISNEEIVMVRSLIQIILAKELMENKKAVTTALHLHLDSPSFCKLMNDFFRKVDEHIDKISPLESLSAYKFFKNMYFEERKGHIDPGLYLWGYSDHKKIICSERIDYRKLECSVLILDGTAIHSKTIYNEEYHYNEMQNYINYGRLHIHHRGVNTSARKRKGNHRMTTQKIIAHDIENLKKQGFKPFPLMNKYEIDTYRQLDVINEEQYNQYFQKSKDKKLPINILNTIGKNYLADQTCLYITSLPNRSAEYYKAVAVSLYENDKLPLDLSTVNKDKKNKNSWFVDERIERIYLEVLLSEINQIIHRSKIRNLLSNEDIHIYIATNRDDMVGKVRSMFSGHKFDAFLIEETEAFENKMEPKVLELAETIRKEGITLPKPIGKIEKGTGLKNVINRRWQNEQARNQIRRIFQKYELDIIELENKEKRIVYFES